MLADLKICSIAGHMLTAPKVTGAMIKAYLLGAKPESSFIGIKQWMEKIKRAAKTNTVSELTATQWARKTVPGHCR